MTTLALRSSRLSGLDVLSRAACVATPALFFFPRALASLVGHFSLSLGMLVVAEVIAAALVIVARPTEKIDRSGWVLLLTIASSEYNFLVSFDDGRALCAGWIVGLVQVIGLSLQLSAKVSLGRSFGLLPANRGVVVRGAYRIVRHPMYLGYVLTRLGFLLATFSAWNLVVTAMAESLLFLRIVAEERVLSRDEAYARYRRQTLWRLIPGLF